MDHFWQACQCLKTGLGAARLCGTDSGCRGCVERCDPSELLHALDNALGVSGWVRRRSCRGEPCESEGEGYLMGGHR